MTGCRASVGSRPARVVVYTSRWTLGGGLAIFP